jgi:uncharacterized protein
LARLNAALRLAEGLNGETDMVRRLGRFAWYELMTADVAAVRAFYSNVVGWEARDASTTELAYILFSAGNIPVSGFMVLPEKARRMGATPRWMGYIGVHQILTPLGGN